MAPVRSLAFVFLGLFGMVGCAASNADAVGTTTTTSAEIPAARESGSGAIPGERPAGQLVCRATSIHEGTIEVYLDWKGTSASGTLRHRTLAGKTTEQRLHAERVKGAIVADDVTSDDLVVHAAMIREHKGHTYVRLGDWKQGWTPCD
jgi:hypothetical protein